MSKIKVLFVIYVIGAAILTLIALDSNYCKQKQEQLIEIKLEELQQEAALQNYIANFVELEKLPKDGFYFKNIIRSAALEYGRELSQSQLDTIYDEVDFWAKKYGIEKALIFGIIEQESEFHYLAKNFNKRNNTLDIGLMQINTITVFDYNNRTGSNVTSDELLYDLKLNIKVGCWALNQKKVYLQKHNCYSTENLIYAYNAGQSKVRKNKVPQTTLNYGENVLLAAAKY